MLRIDKNGLTYYLFNQLADYDNITHFVTTRINSKHFNELNLSYESPDHEDIVFRNRILFANTINLDLNNFVFQHQTHSCNITVIDNEHKSLGVKNQATAIPDNDGYITNKFGICLFVLAADCVPVLFYDPIENVIGAAHSGWRGTCKKISQKTVMKMISTYRSKPENIIAAIGPSIGNCCYEVGNDVVSKFRIEFELHDEIISFNNLTNKYYVDLWKANLVQLMEIGLKTENIEVSGLCTKCNSSVFFSARNGDSGRFGAGIMLNNRN